MILKSGRTADKSRKIFLKFVDKFNKTRNLGSCLSNQNSSGRFFFVEILISILLKTLMLIIKPKSYWSEGFVQYMLCLYLRADEFSQGIIHDLCFGDSNYDAARYQPNLSIMKSSSHTSRTNNSQLKYNIKRVQSIH